MTNKEGLNLIKEAKKIFKRDVKSALKDKDFNMTHKSKGVLFLF